MGDHNPGEAEGSELANFPLALATTPHNLRRFVYSAGATTQVFDETELPGATPDERDRRIARLTAAQMIERAAGVAAKRRGAELLLDLPAAKRAQLLSSSAAAPVAIAQSAPAGAPGRGASAHTTQGGDEAPTAQVSSPRGARSFNLLSPTASPKDEPGILSPEATGNPDQQRATASAASGEGAALTGPEITSDLLEKSQESLLESVQAAAVGSTNTTMVAASDALGAVPLDALVAASPAQRIPALADAFEQLPPALHRYALYNMMRTCSRSTLSEMVSILTSALRSNLLSRLPPELADMVLGYLDAKSLCATSQVCRYWYNLVESNENVWANLLTKDTLNFTELDTRRALKEGWGYTGWTKEGVAAPMPKNAMGSTVNLYKAIYRRKYLIAANWMRPKSRPHHLSIPCAAKDVITCVEFDEDRIIAGTDARFIDIYDTNTGELQHHFGDHDGGVWALKYVNRDTLVSGSTDRSIRVWSIKKARCTHLFRGHSSTVRCLDIVMPVKGFDAATGRVTYTPEHPLIVSGSRDGTLRVWRLPTASDPEHFSTAADEVDPFFIRALTGHTQAVRAINGYGDIVVSGSYDTAVRVWRISTGECLWVLEGHREKVYSAVIDAKRNRCISASMDWSVKVWSIETGTLLYNLEGHTSLVGLLDLKQTTLVSAAADSTLRVWDPETGRLLHKLVSHQGPIACFQHDDNKVVSGSSKKLKLWNIRTGELVGDLFESLDLAGIWQVRFDSRRCVTAVARDDGSYLEVLDFDYDPSGPPTELRVARPPAIREIKSTVGFEALMDHERREAAAAAAAANPGVALNTEVPPAGPAPVPPLHAAEAALPNADAEPAVPVPPMAPGNAAAAVALAAGAYNTRQDPFVRQPAGPSLMFGRPRWLADSGPNVRDNGTPPWNGNPAGGNPNTDLFGLGARRSPGDRFAASIAAMEAARNRIFAQRAEQRRLDRDGQTSELARDPGTEPSRVGPAPPEQLQVPEEIAIEAAELAGDSEALAGTARGEILDYETIAVRAAEGAVDEPADVESGAESEDSEIRYEQAIENRNDRRLDAMLEADALAEAAESGEGQDYEARVMQAIENANDRRLDAMFGARGLR